MPVEPHGAVPEFGARRLVLLGTGALSVAHMPLWVTWFRQCYPGLELRVLLTRTAGRFVSPAALSPMAGGRVGLDIWPDEPAAVAPHAELTEWADMFLVYPATMSFVARLAVGLADSPAALAMQCTRAPVVVVPSLPPGGVDAVSYRRHCDLITERRNMTVVPPVAGYSTTTGRDDAAVAASVHDVVVHAERLRLILT